MDSVSKWLQANPGIDPATQHKLLISILVLLALSALHRITYAAFVERILHIPNGMIFTNGVANHSHGPNFIWNEIPVLVMFERYWEKAKRILQGIADQHDITAGANAIKEVEAAARKFLLKYNKLTAIVYTNMVDSGVMLTIRYLCRLRQRRGSAEAIWEDVLRAFAKHPDIDLAYPTTRFYTLEGSEVTTQPALERVAKTVCMGPFARHAHRFRPSSLR